MWRPGNNLWNHSLDTFDLHFGGRVSHLGWAIWRISPKDHISISHLTGISRTYHHVIFKQGFWISNMDLHFCQVITLPTEPSSWPHNHPFICYIFIFETQNHLKHQPNMFIMVVADSAVFYVQGFFFPLFMCLCVCMFMCVGDVVCMKVICLCVCIHVEAQGWFGNLPDQSSTVFFESMSPSDIQSLMIQLV